MWTANEKTDAADVAAAFESLGGGGLDPSGWALGCEFAFWQRSVGSDSLGLLRWASIKPDNLLKGLQSGFKGVDDEDALHLRDNGDADWAITQMTYDMRIDHSGVDRAGTRMEDARKKLACHLGFLRDKLLEDLRHGDKLFIYRTHDHELEVAFLVQLTEAMRTYGKNTLCYVRHSDLSNRAFTAKRLSDGLIIGYIDHFAISPPNFTFPNFMWNPDGWEAVCRAALALHRPSVEDRDPLCAWDILTRGQNASASGATVVQSEPPALPFGRWRGLRHIFGGKRQNRHPE
jgi:hypothetical protein